MSESSSSYCWSPRLLIIEWEETILEMMIEGLRQPGSPQWALAKQHKNSQSDRGSEDSSTPTYAVIRSLHDLHNFDLSQCDVVICSSGLPDGSGLDALAYIRGVRSDLPVLLTGEPGDTALAVEAIRAGAADFLLTTNNDLRMLSLAVEKCLAHHRIKIENQRLQEDLSRSLAETAVKNRQLQALIQQLETMARTDELTGLCNRRWLNLMLERSWAEATRNDLPLAFMMIDLDGFKTVNDALGHQCGDEVLRLAGRVIEANCRDVDLASRYGGDEFCVLMPNTRPHEAARVGQRVLEAFEEAIGRKYAHAPQPSMSIGIGHIDLSRPANGEQLISHADEALYAAKARGKQRIMMRDRDGVFTLSRSGNGLPPANNQDPSEPDLLSSRRHD